MNHVSQLKTRASLMVRICKFDIEKHGSFLAIVTRGTAPSSAHQSVGPRRSDPAFDATELVKSAVNSVRCPRRFAAGVGTVAG